MTHSAEKDALCSCPNGPGPRHMWGPIECPPRRDALACARETAAWDAARGPATSHSPDERTVPTLLAGILDALIAVAERLPETRVTPPDK